MHRALLLLLAGLALGACADSLTGPDGDDPPGDAPPGDAPPSEEPPPETRTVYDLRLIPEHITIVGTCDLSFGSFAPGEFQYRVEFSGQGESFATQSEGFDERGGDLYERDEGEHIAFGPMQQHWAGLEEDRRDGIRVTLRGTEWDGAFRDADMSRRSGSRTVPFALGSTDRTVTVGADDRCQMRLTYSAYWAVREVPA
jgi:hypothetical protein